MLNSTHVTFFKLNAYFDTGVLKYLYFTIILCLYAAIVFANVLLIAVICMNRNLHEPMYLFLCSLFVNELYGSTGLFPFLLLKVFSDNHTVSKSFCFLQIFCLYSYVCVEFFNLAVMSYDQYLAICHPLQYHTRMTSKKVTTLIALTWFIPHLAIVVIISLSAPLKLCNNIINLVYCGNYAIVKLACSASTVNNIYGLIYTFISVVIPLFFIVSMYMKILKVCFSGSKQMRQKAFSTCTPHIASLLNYSFGICVQIIQRRFGASSETSMLDIISSLYFFTCHPLFTPVLYGLKMTKIRSSLKRVLCGGGSKV